MAEEDPVVITCSISGAIAGRVRIVRRYFELTPGFGPPSADLRTDPYAAGDPLYGVWARRAEIATG